MSVIVVPSTMRALTISGPRKLTCDVVQTPQVGPQEVLVKTAFVGICGTDLHLLEGDSFYLQAGFLAHPFVFGHEYSGTVVAAGDDVRHVAVGDRVAGHCMVPCQCCDKCHAGTRYLCRNLREVGLRFIPGAAAEYVAVPEYAVSVLPPSLPLQTGVLVEPSVTVFHALERACVGSTDRVAVIGTGTLGLFSVLMARTRGRSVDVIGIAPSELAFARELGADRILQPSEVESASYDVVIESSGAPSAFALAVHGADGGGRVALVGLPGRPSTDVDQAAIALKNLTVHGILHGLDYYGAVVDLYASRRVDPTPVVAAVFAPEQAEEAFALTAGSAGERRAPKYLIRFDG